MFAQTVALLAGVMFTSRHADSASAAALVLNATAAHLTLSKKHAQGTGMHVGPAHVVKGANMVTKEQRWLTFSALLGRGEALGGCEAAVSF
jgi:hypothetical protein